MFHVVLFQPEIPPNTGNIIRLCANTGAHLHLVGPLGFTLDEARLRRAHLDYQDMARVHEHDSLEGLLASGTVPRLFALSTRGSADYHEVRFRPGDGFLFGPETRGLTDAVLSQFPVEHRLRIPMLPANRSLNLSNAVAVVVYEAWRQNGFRGRR